MSEKGFYVYILRNPLKNDEPFYVGKGRGRRVEHHLREAKSGKKSYKCSIIRQVIKAGLSYKVEFVSSDVTEEYAFKIEQKLISEIGRKDLGYGPLANKTGGGEGSIGYKHSQASKNKISEGGKGRVVSEAVKEKLRQNIKSNNPMNNPDIVAKRSGKNHWNYGKLGANFGKQLSEKTKRKISESLTGDKHPNFGKPCSDKRREAIRAATIGVKKSTTINMRKPKRKEQCPHCGIWASGGNLVKWHLDKCKSRPEKANLA